MDGANKAPDSTILAEIESGDAWRRGAAHFHFRGMAKAKPANSANPAPRAVPADVLALLPPGTDLAAVTTAYRAKAKPETLAYLATLPEGRQQRVLTMAALFDRIMGQWPAERRARFLDALDADLATADAGEARS